MKFSDYLGGSRTNLSSSAFEYKPVDTDGTINRMQIVQRARDRGRLDQPATEATGFDSVEQEIINQIETVGKEQFDTYLAKQQTYSDRASYTGVQGLSAEISVVANDAKSDFIREVHTGVDHLHALKREVVQTENELELFRRKHQITRSARNQGSHAAHWLILIFVIGIESVVNGIFLQKGNMNGLAGGILYALVIACLNITLGFGAGRLIFPLLNYRNWPVRVLAGFATLGYLSGAFFFNLVVAQYRNATASNPFDASAIAYQHVISNPFGLHDVESWALFAVGLTFSLFAAFDAYRMDDPYPGYRDRNRVRELERENRELTQSRDASVALQNILRDIRRAGGKVNPEEIMAALSKTGELQRENQTLKGQLTQLTNQVKASGRGNEFPSCWVTPDGKEQSIFQLILTGGGIQIVDRHVTDHVKDEAELPLTGVKFNAALALRTFFEQLHPLFNWSVAHGCRFYVLTYSSGSSAPIAEVNAANSYFYPDSQIRQVSK